MSVVYGQLAAKQAAAKALARSGKKKYEYDSDEDVEDGRVPTRVSDPFSFYTDPDPNPAF